MCGSLCSNRKTKHRPPKIISKHCEHINVGQAPTMCLLLSYTLSQLIFNTMGKCRLCHCREDMEAAEPKLDPKACVLPTTSQKLWHVDPVESPLSSPQICHFGHHYCHTSVSRISSPVNAQVVENFLNSVLIKIQKSSLDSPKIANLWGNMAT